LDGCHGPLATSSKLGRTAKQIQGAINAGTGGMGSLSNLTSAQVQAIAAALAQQSPSLPPSSLDTAPPVVTPFVIPSAPGLLRVPISSFSATDNVGVVGYIVTQTATAPTPGDSRWSSSPPSNHAFTSPGNKTLSAWAKDSAGNVSKSTNPK